LCNNVYQVSRTFENSPINLAEEAVSPVLALGTYSLYWLNLFTPNHLQTMFAYISFSTAGALLSVPMLYITDVSHSYWMFAASDIL